MPIPNAMDAGRSAHLKLEDRVRDVITHPLLKEFAERLLPGDDNGRYYDIPLSRVGSLMPYHGHVVPAVVVAALNRMINNAAAGETVFHEFYTEQEQREDPRKRHSGLFFYRGKPGAPFAIVCPGGGFAYVGTLHEGLPLASEISKRGLNAFVLRYRIGEQEGTEDLAAATAFVFRNAEALGVDTRDYSLWGASAGARLVGNIALRGFSTYGEKNPPRPAVVVIAYTGQSTYSSDFQPAFILVSGDDPIANVATVERRVHRLRSAGVEVEYHRYRHAGHGFGLGVGTDAEGWIKDAIQFWNKHRSPGPGSPNATD